MANNKRILAFVGMPGAGKSEATSYLYSKGFPFIRFGEITDLGLKELDLALTPENEQMYREKIREELGMEAYAIKAIGRIEQALSSSDIVVLDGLYSWAEYTYLKEKFPGLTLVHIFAEPTLRHARLSKRPVRPFTNDEAAMRDKMEIERLDKGGPIAIADYVIENDSDLSAMQKKIDAFLLRLGVLR